MWTELKRILFIFQNLYTSERRKEWLKKKKKKDTGLGYFRNLFDKAIKILLLPCFEKL